MMMAAELRKTGGHSLSELRRICALIEATPAGKPPNMDKILSQVARERAAPPQQASKATSSGRAIGVEVETSPLQLMKAALQRPIRIF